jgi:hypothetical protein
MRTVFRLILLLCLSVQSYGQQIPMPIGTGAVTTPSVTTTTFDPAQKAASITLSGGNLTATQTSGGWNSVKTLSSLAKTTGDYYAEILVNSNTSNNIMIGVCNSGASLTSFCGSDVNGWGYYGNSGQIFTGGGAFPGGSTYTNGDIIMVAFKAATGRLWFGRNGFWLFSGNPAANTGTSFTGVTGAIMVMISINSAGSVTGKFSLASFTYTPPTGYGPIQ